MLLFKKILILAWTDGPTNNGNDFRYIWNEYNV